MSDCPHPYGRTCPWFNLSKAHGISYELALSIACVELRMLPGSAGRGLHGQSMGPPPEHLTQELEAIQEDRAAALRLDAIRVADDFFQIRIGRRAPW